MKHYPRRHRHLPCDAREGIPVHMTLAVIQSFGNRFDSTRPIQHRPSTFFIHKFAKLIISPYFCNGINKKGNYDANAIKRRVASQYEHHC